jgi:hypothetical protein
MDNGKIAALREIYQRYGFDLTEVREQENVAVFLLRNGYFDNADLVPLTATANVDKAFKHYSKLGYACTVRKYSTSQDVEEMLFQGFFSVESVRQRLKGEYQRFAQAVVNSYVDGGRYRYINAPYMINDQLGALSPAEEIFTRLDHKKPVLFLIEAAAGFGKTCTAYELVNMLAENGKYLPLFSELSRNREARIFRHILHYELERTFPMVRSHLVQKEMASGRIITILDGFDELLRKVENNSEFESSEPMLETIGEALTGSAKVVVTTRRTILFEGDEFYTWVEKHKDDFDLVTIRINEPRATDWLSHERISKISSSGIEVANISNPVLLSYLHLISNEEFDIASNQPEKLVDRYFEFMLNREKKRQDLRINAEHQHDILQSIALDMMQFGYTSEHRDYIVDHILRNYSDFLDETLALYQASERISREELANKLASHALLDRSAREPNKIGFINDFVLGHYVAQNVMAASDWVSDDMRFIEPAVLAYQARTADARGAFWSRLEGSSEFWSPTEKVSVSLKLRRSISFPLKNIQVDSLTFDNVLIGESSIEDVQFSDCVFTGCRFDLEKFKSVTFLNCRFYENVFESDKPIGDIHMLGAIGDEAFLEAMYSAHAPEGDPIEENRQMKLDQYILEKFWPVGRPTIYHKHRPIKGLCGYNSQYKPNELYATIVSLKKRGLLVDPKNSQFVEINFDRTVEIKNILEGFIGE